MTRPSNFSPVRKTLGDPFQLLSNLPGTVEGLVKVDEATAARIEVVRVLARSLVKGLPGLSWVRDFANSMATIEGNLVARTSLIASFMSPIVADLVKTFEGHDLPFLPSLRQANLLLGTLIKATPDLPAPSPTVAQDLLDLIAKRQEGSTFLEHAKAWVSSRGLLEADSDYAGELGKSVIHLAETFSKEGHSGNSALFARAYFNWMCDAWDGKTTMILNGEDAEKAKKALAKGFIAISQSLCFDAMISRIEAGGRALVGAVGENYKADKILKLDDADKHVLHIVKKDETSVEERFVFGIVLVPEEVDKQNDIYSEAEIRQAAHTFMMSYRAIGDTHKKIITPGMKLDGRVSIVENFIAPIDMVIGGQKIKKGTWLMGVIVNDDKLWEAIKNGDYTGFSIGGEALRIPADQAPKAA